MSAVRDAIGEAWAAHGGIRAESTYARTAHQFRVAGEPWASNSDAEDTDGPKIVAAVVEAALRLGWRTYGCVDTTTTKSIWFQDHEPQAANRVGLDTWVFQAPLGALEAAAGATDGAAVHAGIPVPPANAVSVMCLAIRGSSLLRLAAGSISELAPLIETVIAASWPRGSSRPKSARAGRAVDFQLHSTPWYWAEAGALEGRLFVLRMLGVLAAMGWHIVAPAGTVNRRLQNVGLFFERWGGAAAATAAAGPVVRMPVSSHFVGIALEGSALIWLFGDMATIEMLAGVVAAALGRVFGLNRDPVPRRVLPGQGGGGIDMGALEWQLPAALWLPKRHEELIEAHRAVSSVLAALHGAGYNLCMSLDVTTKEDNNDTLFLRSMGV
nr:hypothetical protein HK105_003633 [Polyrhizophydium stewartii]